MSVSPKRPSVGSTPRTAKDRNTGLKTYFAGWINPRFRIAWVISESRIKGFRKGRDYFDDPQ